MKSLGEPVNRVLVEPSGFESSTTASCQAGRGGCRAKCPQHEQKVSEALLATVMGTTVNSLPDVVFAELEKMSVVSGPFASSINK